MPYNNEALSKKVGSVLRAYGKIGILVDDTAEIVMRRTSRELYGAEVLPRWWVSVRSTACAIDALKSLGAAGAENDPAILIFDRFLPQACGETQTRPWDQQDSEPEGELLGLASILRIRPRTECVFHTSYPDARTSHISWQSRNPELMRGLRRKLAESKETADLLRYGPRAGDGGSHRNRRSRWREIIHGLAIRMARQTGDDEPVILITGAGAALAARPDSPGMPRTSDLLDAAYSFRKTKSFDNPAIARESCLCEPCDVKRNADRQRARSVEELISLLDAGLRAEDVDWNLLELFSESAAEGTALAYALKCVMLRYDTGFPFQHWLLAQLPWTSIITTNFDCFHERAALHVVSKARGARGVNAAYRFRHPRKALSQGVWIRERRGDAGARRIRL